MQIFTVNITRVVWPRVTNLLDLRYFCQPNPLFYHLNLILCHYWSWQIDIYFLVNIFVQHTFSKSKSSIKRKTVLTITDTIEYNEPLAFQRQKVGHKVTVKVSLCICVFSILRRNRSPAKFTCKRLWNIHGLAYLSPPLTGINHYNLYENLT